jgi:hypothetical protein
MSNRSATAPTELADQFPSVACQNVVRCDSRKGTVLAFIVLYANAQQGEVRRR